MPLLKIVTGALCFCLLFPAAAAGDKGPINPDTGLRELPYAINAAPPRYSHVGDTLIRNVNVIDGLGNPVRDRTDLLISDGRIARIARGGSLRSADDVKIIDGAGLTVLPGLIDLHIHTYGGDRFGTGLTDDPLLISDAYRYKTYLYGFLYSGVTTVLDVGAEPALGVGLKRLINDDYILGPRYFWSGPALEGGVEPSSLSILTIPTSDKINQTLDWLQYLDVDFIKLYRRTPIWMLERFTKAAQSRDMRVIVDAWERNNFSYLTQIGRIDGYAHLNFHFPLSDEDARILSEKDNFVITTFYALNAFSGRIYEENPDYYESPLIKNVLPPEYLKILTSGDKTDPVRPMSEMVHHIAIEPVQDLMGFEDNPMKKVMRAMSRIGGKNMRKLMDAGVLVGAGTDGGQGESLLTELELIVADAGLSPVEAIQTATSNAARIIGKDDQFGSIQEGLVADLVIVRGSPDRNIRDLRNLEFVFKEGRIIDRASLTRQWGY